jgi:hypothetical protein
MRFSGLPEQKYTHSLVFVKIVVGIPVSPQLVESLPLPDAVLLAALSAEPHKSRIGASKLRLGDRGFWRFSRVLTGCVGCGRGEELMSFTPVDRLPI